MVEYAQKIICECRWDILGEEKAVVVIMDNCKSQVTEKVLKLLDEHYVC